MLRQNLTILELGWLCPALLSILRGPTPIHSDQNAQLLLQLLNNASCAATTTTTTTTTIATPLLATSTTVPLGWDAQPLEFDGGGTQRAVDWAMTAVYSLVSLFGIVGNILVVIVVRTVPGMITPTNCYLVSLAISDCIFLLSAAPVELSFLHLDSYSFGAIGCKVLSFLPFLGINSSSMSITAFTVERFIGICYPLRARYICTVKRAKLIILFIWCFCILYNSPWLYLATLIIAQDDVQCSFRLERDDWTYKVMFVADFSAFYLLPMVLYIYIYARITYTLTRGGMKYSLAHELVYRNSQDVRPDLVVRPMPDSPSRKNATATNTQQQPQRQARESIVCFSGLNVRRGSTSVKGKIQVIKMLALVVFIFAVCWLPYRAMVMYNSFAKNFNAEMWNPEWFIYLSKTMIFFNCAINPVLYNLMSARFRQAFWRLLSGKKQFINSYKRESINERASARFRGGSGPPAHPLLNGRNTTSRASAVQRIAAGDAEARATLLMRVQKNGTTTCHEMAELRRRRLTEEEEDDVGEERRDEAPPTPTTVTETPPTPAKMEADQR